MGTRCRFVQPEITRLPLSGGDWIDVKKQLNAGEQRRVFGRLVKAMHFNEKTEINPEQLGRSKLAEYIIGWSFVDANGSPVPFSEAAIDNLETDTYRELVTAVDEHEARIDEERAAEKNARGDAIKSSAN